VPVAISLFGLNSGAALVAGVGVLVEVPVMLSPVWFVDRQRDAALAREAHQPDHPMFHNPAWGASRIRQFDEASCSDRDPAAPRGSDSPASTSTGTAGMPEDRIAFCNADTHSTAWFLQPLLA